MTNFEKYISEITVRQIAEYYGYGDQATCAECPMDDVCQGYTSDRDCIKELTEWLNKEEEND